PRRSGTDGPSRRRRRSTRGVRTSANAYPDPASSFRARFGAARAAACPRPARRAFPHVRVRRTARARARPRSARPATILRRGGPFLQGPGLAGLAPATPSVHATLMDLDLKDRVALVTGASRGIGKAI